LVSTGTPEDKERDVFKEAVRKQVEPIFSAALGKSPKEASPDIMDISQRPFRIAWRPNNYRRKTVISEVSDITLKKIGGVYRNIKITKKRVTFIRDYPHVLLIVGRTKLQGVWAQPRDGDKKETHVIERQSIGEVEDALLVKREEIKCLLDNAMQDFISKFGLDIGAEIYWDRYEDWVKGEEVIDGLNPELIVHDTFFKKVYGEGIEFKQTANKEEPVVHLKQYIKNRAVEDVAPEIAVALDGVRDVLCKLVPGDSPLVTIKKLVRVYPDDLLREDVEALIRALSIEDLHSLSDWTFDVFGGAY